MKMTLSILVALLSLQAFGNNIHVEATGKSDGCRFYAEAEAIRDCGNKLQTACEERGFATYRFYRRSATSYNSVFCNHPSDRGQLNSRAAVSCAAQCTNDIR